jgi:hypothetical protein
MSRQAEKKKKVDNDKLNCMLVDVFTFLEAVKAKPSMWADERCQPLREWHGYVSSHPDLFPPVGPQDDVPISLAMEESNLTKGLVSRLWDRQPIDFPREQPCILVRALFTCILHHNDIPSSRACLLSPFNFSTNLSSLQR